MTTKLLHPMRRELDIDGEKFTLTLDPSGFRLTAKGKRKGIAQRWKALLYPRAFLPVSGCTP